MSGKSRRRISPAERARLDQGMAAARDFAAAHPGRFVLACEPIDPGTPCSWRDCPADADPYRCTGACPGCGGCGAQADYLVALRQGGQHRSFPVCRRHRDTMIIATLAASPGGAEIEVNYIGDEP